MARLKKCCGCGQPFVPHGGPQKYCSVLCPVRKRPAPTVYRFVCPDGRSYVGAVSDCRQRTKYGLARSNARLKATFERHSPETWSYEILEQFTSGYPVECLRIAEQRHIERLGSLDQERGFNILAAFVAPEVRARRKKRVIELLQMRAQARRIAARQGREAA